MFEAFDIWYDDRLGVKNLTIIPVKKQNKKFVKLIF